MTEVDEMNRKRQMTDSRHEDAERTRSGRRAAIRAALVFVLSATLAMIDPGPQASAEPVRSRFVEAELVSNVKTIEPGVPFEIALRLSMDPEWHTYWENPGDTGLATTLDIELPMDSPAVNYDSPTLTDSSPAPTSVTDTKMMS